MDENVVQEILHELFTSFERLDTQSSAILQFLKDKGIATDEDFAPYLERAGNASGVRWLAARVRIDHLTSGAFKAEEEKSKQGKSEQVKSQPQPPTDMQNEQDAKTGHERLEKESEKDATENHDPEKAAPAIKEQAGKAEAENAASDQDKGKNGSATDNSINTSEKVA